MYEEENELILDTTSIFILDTQASTFRRAVFLFCVSHLIGVFQSQHPSLTKMIIAFLSCRDLMQASVWIEMSHDQASAGIHE